MQIIKNLLFSNVFHLIIMIILILEVCRLRYIRKIKDRIIDNQCKDLHNALDGRIDLVYKRMTQDSKAGLSCGVCQHYVLNKKTGQDKNSEKCRGCIDYNNFLFKKNSVYRKNKNKK
jgi:hypothetical protein